MAIVRAAPAVDHYLRTIRANHAHHILHRELIAPYFHRPLRAFRKTRVHGAREKLLHSVMASSGEEFRGADYTQGTVLLGADCILAALSARNRKKTDFRTEAVGKIGEQAPSLHRPDAR